MRDVFCQQEASHQVLDGAGLATVGTQDKSVHSPLGTQLIKGTYVGIPGQEGKRVGN